MMKKQPQQPRHDNSTFRQPHLIQTLTQPSAPKVKEEEKIVECKYGVLCAHLRVTGKCQYPHRKNHYLFLNLFPPAYAIDDELEDETKLSKRERKEKKILEKTINENIDVEDIMKKEELSRKKVESERRRVIHESLNEKEKKIVDLNSSTTAQQFFTKLNEIKLSFNVYELKKRSLIQLKKKNEKLFAEIIDKEYRIANRLIKQSLKNSINSLIEIYEDINHNTVSSIREYFSDYLDSEKGIPQEEGSSLASKEKIYLNTILRQLFFREVEEYKYQYYLVKPKSKLHEIQGNIEFYNLMVPYLHSQGSTFNKYLLLDCEESFGLTTFSQILSNDYATTFQTKCKAHPEYPFGQMQANIKGFTHWASKISSKYREKNKEANIIFVLTNISHLFPNPLAQQFEQQKLKQRRETFKSAIKIFQPVVYFLTQSITEEISETLSDLLDLASEGSTRFQKKLHTLEQK